MCVVKVLIDQSFIHSLSITGCLRSITATRADLLGNLPLPVGLLGVDITLIVAVVVVCSPFVRMSLLITKLVILFVLIWE